MKYEQANQPLFRIPFPPFLPPSSKTGDALANDKQMSFSLLKCYDRVIERIYSSITLQSWLHKACVLFCFFSKRKSGFTEREKEREKKEKKRERKRANTSIDLHRERFAGRLEQIFRDGGESESRGQRGGFSKRRALTHPPPSFCVYRGHQPPG